VRRGSLILRVLGASALLAVLIGAVFAILLRAIADGREAALLSGHSHEVLTTANRLERLVIDLESGARGFLLTGDEHFLEPWKAARATIPAAEMKLLQLAVAPEQAGEAQQVAQAIESYVRDYSVPLVDAGRQNDARARSFAVTEDGEVRVDAIRAGFDRLEMTERNLAAARDQHSAATARQATIVAAAGVAGSVALIFLVAGYLTRVIAWPVRRAALMADRLAGGDLSTRIAETGKGEIRTLEHSFNMMGSSLEKSRDELARLAGEQAALRRVATLVAHGEPPTNVFAAVAEEAGRVLGAGGTRLLRYEADGTATVLTSWGQVGFEIPVGTRLTIEDHDVAAQVLKSHRPARIEGASSALGEGVQSAVGVPILVEGHLWGVMKALSARDEPLPEDTEARFADFTDLIATAIANTQARADLAASRARVVTAGDEIRRRIERDLHDGIQQRLVSLTLDLRTTEAGIPADLTELQEQLSAVANGLTGAQEDLREISLGIHPAILSEGGLGPALRALARRAALPVESHVKIEGRLPEPIEVAAYYVVSEALTNASKHSQASSVRVEATVQDRRLHVSIHDNGKGGADPTRGSGLTGLTDRVEALGGKIVITSQPPHGTSLQVELPVASDLPPAPPTRAQRPTPSG
jgi:signal transduction histidine kinase